MKARNNKTGEIVTNFGFSKEFGTASYIDSKGILTFNTPDSGEWTIIDKEKRDFDWQSFRAEAAKDILCVVFDKAISRGDLSSIEQYPKLIHECIVISDELIKQLKEKEEK